MKAQGLLNTLAERVREGESAVADARARGWAVPAWERELNALRLALQRETEKLLAWAVEEFDRSGDANLRTLLIELALARYDGIPTMGSQALTALACLREVAASTEVPDAFHPALGRGSDSV